LVVTAVVVVVNVENREVHYVDSSVAVVGKAIYLYTPETGNNSVFDSIIAYVVHTNSNSREYGRITRRRRVKPTNTAFYVSGNACGKSTFGRQHGRCRPGRRGNLCARTAVVRLFLKNVWPSTIIKTRIIRPPVIYACRGGRRKGRENNGARIKNRLARVLLFHNDGAIIPPQPVRSIIKIIPWA